MTELPWPSARTVETYGFAPFLLYLALKPGRITKTEQRVVLGAAGLLALWEGWRR